MKKILRWTVLVLILFACWKMRDKILVEIGRALVTDDKIEDADAIVVLMGKVSDRTPLTAMLWQEHRAPVVIFAHCEDDPLTKIGFKTNDAEATKIYLSKLGVASNAIQMIEDVSVTSTAEEAQAIISYLLQRLSGQPKVILVTSWSHTSRAAWVLRKESKGRIKFMVAPATTPENSPENWWLSEESFLEVFQEYLKWIYYLLK